MRKVFSKLIGNGKLLNELSTDIESSSLAHAYIIDGNRGSGKHTLALQIAAAVACENKSDKNQPLPCGCCKNCRKILTGNSPDVITIGRNGKVNLPIEQIRFLRTDASIYPNDLDTKIYIIEDAHTMTVQAQNALLLTLEEPPAYVLILLLCENNSMLLETIRSRAPILRTCPVPSDEIKAYLIANDTRASTINSTDPDRLNQIITASGGYIGQALELLDSKAGQAVLEARKAAYDFVCTLASRDTAAILSLINKNSGKREDTVARLENVCPVLRDLMAVRKYPDAPLCFFTDRDSACDLSEKFTATELSDLYSSIFNALTLISKNNSNVRLTLMNAAVSSGIIK